MDWTNVVVACLAFLGSAYGSFKSHDKIRAVMEYRLKELEKKQDKHNAVIDRVYALERQHSTCKSMIEEKMKVANHRIDDLEEELKK